MKGERHMELSHNNLQIAAEPLLSGAMPVSPVPLVLPVPLATEADFSVLFDFRRNQRMLPVNLYQQADSDSYAYHNVETCPDCGGGMIRQGRCCACPSCGFESCLV
jgi:hypothetical protein